MVQQIGSFMAGGYVAGRMRSRWGETNRAEVGFVMVCMADWCGL